MKITCQSCQSKYTVSDEKVQGKTVKIKCRKCGATILVNSSGATSQSNGGVADPVSTSGGTDGSYLVNVADGDQRTMSAQDLIAAYQSGVVNAETYVWADGMADWQPISQVDALVAALNAGVPEASAYPEVPGASAYAQQAPAAAYDPGPAYAAAPAASPAPAAAAYTPEPAPRAAVRRDPMRRSQDLFGGGMAAQQTARDDVATSAPLFSAPVAGGTGQRDENSTLFSLSALTAKAAAPTSSPRTTATREDSGLIDLKALAESGPAAAPTNLVPDHGGGLGLFPLGAPIAAAPVAMAVPGSIPAPPAKRSPIFIIIGSVVALAAIIGVFFAVKGGGEKPVPTADTVAAAAPPTPTATAGATPTATATAAATASAEASTDASAAPSAKAHAGRGGGRGGGVKGGSAGKAPAAAEAPAAKPAGKGNCGCAAGDLMCAMRCSAK